MEETKDVSLKSVAIKYGFINGLVGVILFTVIDMAGLSTNAVAPWIGFVVMAVLMFLAQKEFIKGGDGFMNYGQGLGLGTLMSVVSGVISSIYTFIYVSYINTAYFENMKELQIVKLEEQGMSDAQIEQTMQMMDSFSGPVPTAIFGILGTVFFGFLIALIVSAIAKKSRPEFE